MSAEPNPRRGAHAPQRSRGRTGRLIETLLVTIVAALVVIIALTGVGSTHAYWSDEQTLDGAVVGTGTAGLAMDYTEDAPSAMVLLPGESVHRDAELANTGDVPLEIDATLAEDLRGVAVSVAAGGCGDPAHAAALSTTSSALTGTDGGAVVLPAGDAMPLCVVTRATEHLTPGQTVTFTLTVDGKQVQ